MGRSSELDGLTTLPELLAGSIEKYDELEALRQYNRAANAWDSLTYRDLGEQVLTWRRAFAASNLRRGERIAILMPNGFAAVFADQAALANGLVPVPLHAIDTPGASAFVIIDSQSSVLVTNNLARWKQICATGVEMPDLRLVVIAEREGEGEPEPSAGNGPQVAYLDDWLKSGKSCGSELPAGPSEDDLAGIIYTSGTTGKPKGVMLTHKNIVSNVKATLECVSPQTGDVFLSFLPLSHTFERTAGYYLALATGCAIVYNRSILLLAEDLRTARPTVIISVPRVDERSYARLREKLKKSSRVARRLFGAAVETGWRDFCRRNKMPPPSKASVFDGLVRSLLLKKVADALLSQFGGRLRIAISGGAAINPEVAKIFCGLGLPIIQGYGMTEASPIIAGNCVEENQPDTVGRPFCNIDVRIGAEDEIQLKGPSVMKGYWRRPEATAEAFTSDGWLKTGDVGEFTEQGLLRIKGRIKEIIVTSTGEKIPPADLESAIEADPLFAQTFVVGENRPFLTLIAVVDRKELEAALKSANAAEDADILELPEAKAIALKRAKAAASRFPNYALPRAVILTEEPWTIETGELTPTLKLKRGPLMKRFAGELGKIYGS